MDSAEVQSAALKQIEKEILKEIIIVCEKLQLRYYIMGGSLIGAIRHKGFIPWDDDIDIAMPREDYETFLKEAKSLLPEHLFLQSIWSDSEFLQCFAKVRNSNTTFVEIPVKNQKMHHGVFVDIFPLDYYPEDPKLQKKYERKKKLYYRRIVAKMEFDTRKSFKNKLGDVLIKLLFPSWRSVLKKQDKLYRSVPKSNLFTKTGGYKNEVIPVSWYGEGTTVTFEDLQVKAPKQYDKLLTHIYGEYMVLPPKEKQVGHHYTAIMDLEKPYTYYFEK